MDSIFDNGIDTRVTEEQAAQLLAAKVIYPCEEHGTFHVTPDFEDDYEGSTGAFSILR